MDRDLGAFIDAAIDADAFAHGLGIALEPPRRGQEIAHWVLGVKPRLDRRALELDVALGKG